MSLRPVTHRITAALSFPAPNPSPPSKPKDVDKSKLSLRPVTRRVSTNLDFPASAPLSQNSRSGEGVAGGDKEVAEPYSVYTVRRRKRSNDVAPSSSAVASLRLDLIPSQGKKRRQATENTAKPSGKVNSGKL